MKHVVEYIGYFRIKAGCEYSEIEMPESFRVLDLIIAVEKELKDRSFNVLEGNELKDGVLLFRRNEQGGMVRCKISAGLSETGGRIIMANLMGGG
ncbi:MAG TPA: hypothetical protein DCO79_14640 [Spirochaeta sp.]|nr:hypothetical protein [Spirochaeta sp.]